MCTLNEAKIQDSKHYKSQHDKTNSMFPLLIFCFAASSSCAATQPLTSPKLRLTTWETHLRQCKYLKYLILEQQLCSGDSGEQRHRMCRETSWVPAGLEALGKGTMSGGGRPWGESKCALKNHCNFSHLFWNCKCCKVTTREPQQHVRKFVLSHRVKIKIHYNSV